MIVRQTDGRHVAWFDVHVPHQNPLREVLAFNDETGCTDMILGGDFMDCAWSSHWNEAVFAELGHGKLREMFFQEMDAAEKVVAEVRKSIGPKARFWYLPGNHEAWLWYSVWNHRFIAPPVTVDPKKIHFKSDVASLMDVGLGRLLDTYLHAEKYGLRVLPYNEPLRIGNVVYVHGNNFTGQDPTQNSAKRWPSVNLVMGHHHTHKVNTIFSPDPRKVYQHVVCPALCGLAPGYLKDKSTRWLNGFWVADMKDGLFDGRVVKVFDGKIIKRD